MVEEVRVSLWRSLPTWGLWKVSIFSSFISASTAAVFGFLLICCSPGLCHPTIIAILSIILEHYIYRRNISVLTQHLQFMKSCCLSTMTAHLAGWNAPVFLPSSSRGRYTSEYDEFLRLWETTPNISVDKFLSKTANLIVLLIYQTTNKFIPLLFWVIHLFCVFTELLIVYSKEFIWHNSVFSGKTLSVLLKDLSICKLKSNKKKSQPNNRTLLANFRKMFPNLAVFIFLLSVLFS